MTTHCNATLRPPPPAPMAKAVAAGDMITLHRMPDNDASNLALEQLACLAELAAISLSLNHYFTVAVGKVSEAEWQRLFDRNPVWFDLYFLPPTEMLARAFRVPGLVEHMRLPGTDGEPNEQLLNFLDLNLLDRARGMGRQAVAIGQELANHDGEIVFAVGPEDSDKALHALTIFKVVLAEMNARCHYGQGMHALISAGQRGIDAGYLRAVTIDPTIQWHPFIVERVSREALAGRADFADALGKAAQSGPSKHIDKELFQLRYLLSLLHELKVLQSLTDADRYTLFCHQLGLYPDAGKNPKAALCTFIDRWEVSLL